MMHEAPDALRCDMAQFYQVHDIRALDPEHVAILAAGLPERSRSMRHAADDSPDPLLLLLAAILDQLRLLRWDGTEENRPPSVVERMLGKEQAPDEYRSFDSAEAFEAARAEILEKEAAEHGGQ